MLMKFKKLMTGKDDRHPDEFEFPITIKPLPTAEILYLRRTFKKISPQLLQYFDRMKDAIAGSLENRKINARDMWYFEKAHELERQCKHVFENKGRDNRIGYYIRECTKCGKRENRKKIRRDNRIKKIKPVKKYIS